MLCITLHPVTAFCRRSRGESLKMNFQTGFVTLLWSERPKFCFANQVSIPKKGNFRIAKGIVTINLFKQGCGEITLRRIGKHGNNCLAFAQHLCQLHCRRNIRTAGNTAENAFLEGKIL